MHFDNYCGALKVDPRCAGGRRCDVVRQVGPRFLVGARAGVAGEATTKDGKHHTQTRRHAAQALPSIAIPLPAIIGV